MLFLYLSLFSIKKDINHALQCLKGTWNVENTCPFLQEEYKNPFRIDIKEHNFFFNDFLIDINPKRWFHGNTYYFTPIKHRPNYFSIRSNRERQIGEIPLEFLPHCEVKIGHIKTDLNISLFGRVLAGEGYFTFSNQKDVCQFKIQKKIDYSNWQFGLTIMIGVASMFFGYQIYNGWNLSELSRPHSIPIDNPGEEYIDASGIASKKTDQSESGLGNKDEFKSEDGY